MIVYHVVKCALDHYISEMDRTFKFRNSNREMPSNPEVPGFPRYLLIECQKTGRYTTNSHFFRAACRGLVSAIWTDISKGT